MQNNFNGAKEYHTNGESNGGTPGEPGDGLGVVRSKRKAGESIFSAYLRRYESNSLVSRYSMQSSTHGFAVIIANEHFNSSGNDGSVQLKDRPNVKAQVDHLRDVFRRLGYIVCVYPDLTAEQLMSKSDIYCSKDHRQYDAFICCILSRGTPSHVYGSDGIAVSLQEFVGNFNGRRSPSLGNKPKLFFTETYSGPKVVAENVLARNEKIQVTFSGYCMNSLCEVSLGEELQDAETILPNDFDFFIANCTYKGKLDPPVQTNFIMTLADRLDSWSHDHNVVNLLEHVKHSLKHRRVEGCRMSLTVESTLRKSLTL
ncbi:caspase-8-like [Glandiceps talaboti]